MAKNIRSITDNVLKLNKQMFCSYNKFNAIFPRQSQVVICGAGVVGNSIAYHLTQAGWKDVIVLEQNQICSGTSFYGSGVLGLFRKSAEHSVVTQSVHLIDKLQKDGHQLGLRKCGSLNLARTEKRAIALKRRMAYAIPNGIKCQWLTPQEIQTLHPHVNVSDLEGGVYVPDDSVADIQAVCKALAATAQKQGAKYFENCRVLNINSEILPPQVTPRVTSINTTKGVVQCEYFVNAAGMWSRHLGQNSKPPVRIPTFAANHYYLHTVPMQEATDELPVVRDYDSWTFCLTQNNKFVIGGFEPQALPTFENEVPQNWRDSLEVDEAHFQMIKDNALKRFPILQNSQFEPLINAPDNFTPDGKWILGETPEIDNYFVACGMNGNSIQGGCGAGLTIAEWIIHGAASSEMLFFDVRRFIDLHNNRRFLKERTREIVAKHYEVEYPGPTEYKYARKLRRSPIYSELEARGAVFGSRMGFERPLYFDTDHKKGKPPAELPEGSFGKPPYINCIKEEYYACREAVGIIDLSSFTKIEIKAAGQDEMKAFEARESKLIRNEVVDFLQKLCSNDVNVPVSGVVHTGMHNERGGYENDCMLIRTSENAYLMLAPTIQQTRIMDWMRRQMTADSCVSVDDITSMYTVLSVIGPKSRDVLSLLCNTNLAFYGHTVKMINIAYASGIYILSYTHMGEPGYTLIIPSEYTLHIYNRLMKAGQDYGIRNVGMITMRSLRVEKFIPFWAEELDSTVNPYEVGRGYRVKLNKDYFIGKFALMQEEKNGSIRRLVHFVMEDEWDPDLHLWPLGNEPIFRNGIYVGNVTSSAFGFTMNKMVCLGWVRHPDGNTVSPNYILKDSVYEIDIAGKKFKAKARLQPPTIPVVKMDGVESYRPRVRGIVTQK